MTSFSHLRLDITGAIATLTINHQDRSANVLTVELVDELTALFCFLRRTAFLAIRRDDRNHDGGARH